MKRKKFTDKQRADAVADLKGGMSTADVSKKYGVSENSLYKWSCAAGNGDRVKAQSSRDAIVFLRKAKKELEAGLRSGKITDLDNAHLMMLLAHNALTGK